MVFEAVDFLEEAVRTESHESPDEMRNLVLSVLRENGFDPVVDDVGNVIVSKGRGGKNLVMETHMDTVPPHVEFEREDGIIRGRGACDAKGSLASMLYAFIESDVEDKLTLIVTPDEESKTRGAYHMIEKDDFEPDSVIVGEPTGLDICNCSRGRYAGIINIEGESAHASQPEKAENPIKAVKTVEKVFENFDEGKDHEVLREPGIEPTIIEGGEIKNAIPEEISITFDRRSLPGETPEEFMGELEDTLRTEISPDYDLSVTPKQRESPFPIAFHTDKNSEIIECMKKAGAGRLRPFGAAAESSAYTRIAPTIIFGPGKLTDEKGPVAHSEREYIKTSEVEKAGDILRKTVEEYLN
jgi:acetylornithine deacetylase/succinyl-diaminopimelate desuccinylase-like protein